MLAECFGKMSVLAKLLALMSKAALLWECRAPYKNWKDLLAYEIDMSVHSVTGNLQRHFLTTTFKEDCIYMYKVS